MSWFKKVRNSIPFIAKRETSDNLWHKCRGCREMIFLKEFEELSSVCPKCDHHERIGARTRFLTLFDDGHYHLLPQPRVQEDPLKFKDSKKYSERIKTARGNNEFSDALCSALGKIDGHKVVVSVQDFAFMGGSMGQAVGQAFIDAAEKAIAEKCPFIIFTAAGGARMQEGILSLMQMARTTVAINRLKAQKLPYIVVLTDPTTGGVTASYAMLGDVQLAEPKALIGFAGQRVIQDTIREQLPEGFQRAEYLLDHGMIDMVVERKEMRMQIALLLAYLSPNQQAA